MKKVFKWIAIVLGVLILISLVSTKGEKKESTVVETTTTTTKVEDVKVYKQVDINALVDDFEANQVSAEKKWNGQLVKFSATITNITDNGISFTKVGSKDFSMSQVSCHISDKAQLLTIKNGQSVTVQGKVGNQTFGIIDVDDCSLVN